MQFSRIAVVAFTLAGVYAQSSSTGNSTADTSQLSDGDRSAYCNAQINTCGALCNGANGDNTCDTTSLQFDCTCAANDSAPGLQYYTGTVPTFLCELAYSQCIARGENNAAAQRLCTANREANCGTLSPPNVTDSTSSSSTTSSASRTASNTASSTSATPTNSDNASSLLKANSEIGLGMLMAAVFGYFL